ncbi:MAG: hypothetical protein FWD04_06035 [Conexibacteraceae bacterium]|nr:hypothetical protein [Conexibacteraceae bacterium]
MTTGTEISVDTLAERIAGRGRTALVERMRSAYAEAAAKHADIVSLDGSRMEALVQGAADRADGLQWRRALAGVASEELGVSVPEALSHPAVARAQTLVGAPSYEQSLAALSSSPVPPAGSDNGAAPAGALAAAPAGPTAPDEAATQLHQAQPAGSEPVVLTPDPQPAEEPEPLAEELEPVRADDAIFDLLPEPLPEPEPMLDTQVHEAAGQYIPDDPPAPAPKPFTQEELERPMAWETEDLRVSAIHLGGVASLPTHGDGLEVRLSSNGLDILQGADEILGRLIWSDIDALEVPNPRMRMRRQQNPSARMVVRTPHGDASFEIPGLTTDELRDRIEPLVEQYGHHA